jgi:predicted nucleic acid-binding protein
MTYLFDTDVLIEYFKHRDPWYSRVEKILQKQSSVISVITLTELRAGWDGARSAQWMPVLYDLFTLQDITSEIAVFAGEQIKKYQQKGSQLSTTDTLIAATAILSEYCLVTGNGKDYPMPELRFYDSTSEV